MIRRRFRKPRLVVAVLLAIGALCLPASGEVKPKPQVVRYVELLLAGRAAAVKLKLQPPDRANFDKVVAAASQGKVDKGAAVSLFSSVLVPDGKTDPMGVSTALTYQGTVGLRPNVGKLVAWLHGELGLAEKLRSDLGCKGDTPQSTLLGRLAQARATCTPSGGGGSALTALQQSGTKLQSFEVVITGTAQGDPAASLQVLAAAEGTPIDILLGQFAKLQAAEAGASDPDQSGECKKAESDHAQLLQKYKTAAKECQMGDKAQCGVALSLAAALAKLDVALAQCAASVTSSSGPSPAVQAAPGIKAQVEAKP